MNWKNKILNTKLLKWMLFIKAQINPQFFKIINRAIPVLIAGIIYILFHPFFEKVIGTLIVDPFVRYFETSIFADLCLIAICSYFIIEKLNKSKKYKYYPSIEYLVIMIFTTTIYSMYRSNAWSLFIFYHLELATKLYYTDIIYILTSLNLYLWAKNFLLEFQLYQNSINNQLSNDTILNPELEEDQLGFTKYADQISELILNDKHLNSFAFGIVAPWGYGKSSFVELIKYNLLDKINGDEIIWIKFDPWKSSTTDSIIEDFFKQIEQKLKVYSSDFPSLLRQYAKKLKSIPIKGIEEFTNSIPEWFFPERSLEEIKIGIEERIQALDKKIIIFIDDLDRAKGTEIWEILKLIRNTANFPNTVYLVAYDKSFILNQLKEFNHETESNLLEKIFQLEITLPGYGPNQLRQILKDKLKLVITDSDILDRFNRSIDEYGNHAENTFDKWINSIRDVNRIFNSIVMNILPLVNEISIHDFLRLEYLKLKFPDVHRLIYLEFRSIFELSKNLPANWELKINHPNKSFFISDLLTNKSSQYNLKTEQISKITSLLNSIFTFKNSFIENDTSVANPRYFGLYFQFSIPYNILSKKELLSKINTGNIDIVKEAVNNWINSGLQESLQERLKVITRNKIESQAEFEFKVKIILHFICQPNQIKELPFETCYFPPNDLIKFILDFKNEIIGKYYYGNEAAYKEFILSCLKGMKSQPFVRNKIIKEIILQQTLNSSYEENYDERPFTFLELEIIVVSDLDKMISASNIWSEDLYSYCLECSYEKYKHYLNLSVSKNPFYFETAKELIVNFLTEFDLDGFLLLSINNSHREDGYEISKLPYYIFGSYGEFKKFLQSQNPTRNKYLIEYLEFFESCSYGEDNIGPTKFNFKIIPVKT